MATFKFIALFSVLSFGMTLNSLAMYDYIGSFFGRETDAEIRVRVSEIIDNGSTIKEEFCRKLQQQQDLIIEELKNYIPSGELNEYSLNRSFLFSVLFDFCRQAKHDMSIDANVINYFQQRCKELGLENKINLIDSGWSTVFVDMLSREKKVLISKLCFFLFSKSEIFAMIDHELTHLLRTDTHLYSDIEKIIPTQNNDLDTKKIDQLLIELVHINEIIADQFPALESDKKARASQSVLFKFIIIDIVTLCGNGYKSLRGSGSHPSTIRRYLDACRIARYLEIEKQLNKELKTMV